MSEEIRAASREIGELIALSMFKDPFYDGTDLDEILDDAWMSGAADAGFAEAGIDRGDDVQRKIAKGAFKEGFTAAMNDPAAKPIKPGTRRKKPRSPAKRPRP
jgi:hypothetical protein